MVLRLIHSADWHLGQTLHGYDRAAEHGQFLDWLVELLDTVAADALLVAGDVFDSPNPPVSAQRALFRFLAEARRRRPALQVVMVAGNHDGATRLEAPAPLLAELGVQMVGPVPRDAQGRLDPAALVLPLRDGAGAVAAWCVAMPFLRPADLPALPLCLEGPAGEEADVQAAAAVALYAQALAAARERQRPGQAMVAMGHAALAGGLVSELSERRILCGGLHALPVTVFPEDVAYVALGHLHRAQAVGGRAAVRYSGSPLPLALNEDNYCHQVIQVDLKDGALHEWSAIAVPRMVAILRLPAGVGAGENAARLPPESLEAAFATLPPRSPSPDALPPERWPYLEVRVRLDAPRPGLVAEVGKLLEDRAVRLARLDVRLEGAREALAESAGAVALASLSPETVFQRCWESRYGQAPPAAMGALFRSLMVQAADGMGEPDP